MGAMGKKIYSFFLTKYTVVLLSLWVFLALLFVYINFLGPGISFVVYPSLCYFFLDPTFSSLLLPIYNANTDRKKNPSR
jgi:hypothetical protein